MIIPKNPKYKIIIQGGLNANQFDYFWAHCKLSSTKEPELIREMWKEKWDKMSDGDKLQVKRYLEKNPSPRMERDNKLKCE